MLNKKCVIRYSKLPPCIKIDINRYSYLEDFVSDTYRSKSSYMVHGQIKALKINSYGGVDIKDNMCISCMFCVFGCPSNQFIIDKYFKLTSVCSSKDSSIIDFSLFNGALINLPKLSKATNISTYKSFEEFTGINETTNLSIWGANTLKFLSKNKQPRLGVEVGLKLTNMPRNGRLDICLLNDNKLFIAESKISLQDMLINRRFLAQMLSYSRALKEQLPEEIICFRFFLIGGKETDLLPPNHELCSSNVGDYSERFYKLCVKHKLFFISANALLSLGLMKIKYGQKWSIEYLASKIFQKSNIGLLSCGIVSKEIEGFMIKELQQS